MDLLVDINGADLFGFFAIGVLYNDLEEVLEKELDMVTVGALEQPVRHKSDIEFQEAITRERREIYAILISCISLPRILLCLFAFSADPI